jgi:molybdopterin converting factor small subunit
MIEFSDENLEILDATLAIVVEQLRAEYPQLSEADLKLIGKNKVMALVAQKATELTGREYITSYAQQYKDDLACALKSTSVL